MNARLLYRDLRTVISPTSIPTAPWKRRFETVLAEHEAECNDVLLCSKFEAFHWPHGATDKLAFYIALLYSRATPRRAYSSKQWTKILDELRETIEDVALIKEIADATALLLEWVFPCNLWHVPRGPLTWNKLHGRSVAANPTGDLAGELSPGRGAALPETHAGAPSSVVLPPGRGDAEPDF